MGQASHFIEARHDDRNVEPARTLPQVACRLELHFVFAPLEILFARLKDARYQMLTLMYLLGKHCWNLAF
jgi:hypothetical protein